MSRKLDPDSDELPLITFTPRQEQRLTSEEARRGPDRIDINILPTASPSRRSLPIPPTTNVSGKLSPETRRRRYRPKHTFERLVSEDLVGSSRLLGEEGFWDDVLRPNQASAVAENPKTREGEKGERVREEEGEEPGEELGEEEKERAKWLLADDYGLAYKGAKEATVGETRIPMERTKSVSILTPIQPSPLQVLPLLLDREHELTVDRVKDCWKTLMMLSADRSIYETHWRDLHRIAQGILGWLDGSRLETLLVRWIRSKCLPYDLGDAHPLLILDLAVLLGDTVPGQVAATIVLDAALALTGETAVGLISTVGTECDSDPDQVFIQWLTHQYTSRTRGLSDLCTLYRLTLLANARLHRTPLARYRSCLTPLLTALVRAKTSLPRATPSLTLLAIRARESLGYMEALLRTLSSKSSIIEELVRGQ